MTPHHCMEVLILVLDRGIVFGDREENTKVRSLDAS